MHVNGDGHVYMTGSSTLRTTITSAAQAMNLIEKGRKNRAVGRTNCNEHSSRSHAILTLHIESRISRAKQRVVKLGKLHLIDLAGSERLAMSGAQGSTLLETQNINLSLSTLGDVLSALSKYHATVDGKISKSNGQKKMPLVPYRNSKLTLLLKDSLGGNSKTIMIATIRTLAAYKQQTLMILMYASRAKLIKNATKINTDKAGASKASSLIKEIDLLKSQLKKRETALEDLRKNGLNLSELHRLSQENAKEKKRLEECLQQVVHNHASTLAAQQQKYNALQSKLGKYEAVFHQQQQEIAVLRQTVKHLSRDDDIKETRKVVEQLVNALETSRKETQSLRMKMGEMEVERSNVEQQNESLLAERNELKKLIQAKDDEYEALRAKCATTIDNAQKEIAQVLKDKDSEIAEAKAKAATLQREKDAIRSEVNPASKVEVMKKAKEISKLEATVEHLKELLEQREQEVASAKFDNASKQARNREVEEELDRVENQLAAVETERAEIQEKLDREASTARSLQEKLQDEGNRIREKEKKLKAQVRGLESSLESIVSQSKKELEGKLQELSVLKGSQARASDEIRTLRNEKDQLQSSLITVQSELELTKSKEVQAVAAVEELQNSRDSLEQSTSERISTLTSELQALKQEKLFHNRVVEEHELMKAQFEELKLDAEKYSRKIQDMEHSESNLKEASKEQIDELKSKLKAEELKVKAGKRLEESYSDLQAELASYKAASERISKALEESKASYNALKDSAAQQVSSLQSRLEAEKAKSIIHAKTAADLLQAEEAATKLRSERVQIRKDVKSLKSSREKALARAESLQTQLTTVVESVCKQMTAVASSSIARTVIMLKEIGVEPRLPSMPEVSTTEARHLEKSFEQMATFLSDLELAVAKAIRKANKTSSSQVAELERGMHQGELALKKSEANIAKLSEALREAESKLAKSTAGFQAGEARLQSELKGMEASLHLLAKEKEEMRTEVMELKLKRADDEAVLQSKINIATSETEATRERLESARIEVSQLQNAMHQLSSKCKLLQDRSVEKDEELGQLYSKMAKLEEEQSAGKVQLETLKVEGARSAKETRETLEELKRVESSKLGLEQTLSERSKEAEKKEAAFLAKMKILEESINETEGRFTERIAVLEKEKQALQDRLANTQETVDSLQREKASNTDSILRLKDSIDSLGAEKAKLEVEVSTVQVELDAIRKRQVLKESLEVQHLRRTLQEVEAANNKEYENVVNQHREESEAFNRNLEELRSTNESTSKELREALAFKEKLVAQLAEAKKLETLRTDEVAELQRTTKGLEEQCESLEQSMAATSADLVAAEAEITEVRKSLDLRTNALEYARSELDLLKSANERSEKEQTEVIDTLKRSIRALEEEKTNIVQNHREAMDNLNDAMKEEASSSRKQVESLQMAVQSLTKQKEEEVSMLHQKLKDVKDETIVLQSNASRVQERHNDAVVAMEQQVALLEADLISQKKTFEATEAEKDNAISRLRQEVAELHTDLEVEKANADKLQTEQKEKVSCLEQQVARLETDLKVEKQHSERVVSEKQEALSVFEERIERMRSDVGGYEERVKELEGENAQQAAALEKQGIRLQNNLSKEREKIEVLTAKHESDIESLEQEVHRLQTELSSQREQEKVLKQRAEHASGLEAQVKILQNELAQQKQYTHEVSSKSGKVADDLVAFKEQLEIKAKELEEVVLERDRLVLEVNDQKNALAAKSNKLAESVKAATSHRQAFEAMQVNLAKLTAELETLKRVSAEKECTLSDQCVELKQQLHERQKVMAASHRQALQVLQTKLTNASAEIETLQRVAEEKQRSLTGKCVELQRQLDETCKTMGARTPEEVERVSIQPNAKADQFEGSFRQVIGGTKLEALASTPGPLVNDEGSSRSMNDLAEIDSLSGHADWDGLSPVLQHSKYLRKVKTPLVLENVKKQVLSSLDESLSVEMKSIDTRLGRYAERLTQATLKASEIKRLNDMGFAPHMSVNPNDKDRIKPPKSSVVLTDHLQSTRIDEAMIVEHPLGIRGVLQEVDGNAEKLEASLQASEKARQASEKVQAQLRADLAMHQKRIKNLEEQQKAAKTWVKDLTQQRDHLDMRLNESREDAEELFRQTQRVAQLQQTLDSLKQRCSVAESERDGIHKRLERSELEKSEERQRQLNSFRSMLESHVTNLLVRTDETIMQQLERSSATTGEKVGKLEVRFKKFVEHLHVQLEAVRKEKMLVQRDKKQFRRRLERQNEKKMDSFQRSVLTKQRDEFRNELDKIRSDQLSLLALAKSKRGQQQPIGPGQKAPLNAPNAMLSKPTAKIEAIRSQGFERLNILNAALKGDAQALHSLVTGPGHERIVASLCKQGSKDFLPLHRCVSGYHFHASIDRVVKCIELLVTNGADIDATDQAGNSVLHKVIQVMASDSVLPVLKMLLALGANPSARNVAGDTPLHTEIRRLRSNSLDIVKLLVQNGAMVNMEDGKKLTPLELVEKLASAPEIQANTGTKRSGVQSFWTPVLEFMRSVAGSRSLVED